MAISKRKNGRFQARISGPDGRIMAQTFPTYKEAEIQLLKWKQKKFDGLLGTSSKRQTTLDEYFEEWYQDVLEENPENLRSGWRQTQRQHYKDYVSSEIGGFRLTEIRPENIKRVLNNMAMLGKSNQTRIHVFRLIRRMFGDAIEVYQYMNFNPALKKFKPDLPVKEAKHLNLDQTKLLLTYVENRKYGLAIWIQLYLGLRVGELQALKWEDIDLTTGRITVRRTYNRKKNFFREYPKGKRQHSHNLPPELWEKLIIASQRATGELVVTSPCPRGEILPYRWYLKALKGYCRELKITKLGTHGLRHSTSEVYMSHGATRDDLRALFAHSSLDITERYLHGKDTNLEKVTNVISLFRSSTTPKRPQIEKTENCQKMEVS